MTKRSQPKALLRRYTSLPILIDMLANKRVTFVDPTSWEDRNDSFFLERYREFRGLKTVVAICFTTRSDTFHHWKVFAGNPAGVCVRFDRDALVARFDGVTGIRTGAVMYRRVRELSGERLQVEGLPFLKRKPFQDEAEFRIIYESEREAVHFKHFELDLEMIDSVMLSPWLPVAVLPSVRRVVHELLGSTSIRVYRSSIIDDSKWKATTEKLRRSSD